MEQKERISEKKIDVDNATKGDIIESKSAQYNYQDLDQEQKVDVNPKQNNAQNIYIYVNSSNGNLSAKLTGVTYVNDGRRILPNVRIRLFFGLGSVMPVCELNSDKNGHFAIEDLPPGYYTLSAEYGNLRYYSHFIKLLPAQKVHVSVVLR